MIRSPSFFGVLGVISTAAGANFARISGIRRIRLISPESLSITGCGVPARATKAIAAREGIDNSYVSRMVNLTTLAPDIVAAILDDAMPNHVTLFDLAVDPPALWEDQRARLR